MIKYFKLLKGDYFFNSFKSISYFFSYFFLKLLKYVNNYPSFALIDDISEYRVNLRLTGVAIEFIGILTFSMTYDKNAGN